MMRVYTRAYGISPFSNRALVSRTERANHLLPVFLGQDRSYVQRPSDAPLRLRALVRTGQLGLDLLGELVQVSGVPGGSLQGGESFAQFSALPFQRLDALLYLLSALIQHRFVISAVYEQVDRLTIPRLPGTKPPPLPHRYVRVPHGHFASNPKRE